MDIAHARSRCQDCPRRDKTDDLGASGHGEQTRLSLEYEMSRENKFLRNQALLSWMIRHVFMLHCWPGLTIRNLEKTRLHKLSGNLRKEELHKMRKTVIEKKKKRKEETGKGIITSSDDDRALGFVIGTQ